jgi:tetratricopeptide (TPR) repeat protein
MKKPFVLFFASLIAFAAFAQTDDPKTLYETAKNFMRTGDFDNAIVVLGHALEQDKNNLDMQKDMVMCYYLKRDYVKALEGVKNLIDRKDADEACFQIAGNVYKALEQPKDCEKVYKKGLKKFPKSGPLYSEYGELLWATKDYSAIDQWEKGIEVDPSYSGNYYNAALYYFYTKDKVWSLLYGEIFVNMESLSERGTAMKQLLLQAYKEKLFADPGLMKGEEKNKSEFAKAFLEGMSKQYSLAAKGITAESLTMIRTRFILDWFDHYATKFPFRLFDFQRQLIQEGMFDAYNQWLFGITENPAAYDNWTKTHEQEYNSFTAFQRSRVFRMPSGQYYQVK